jgi:hypothetical protein
MRLWGTVALVGMVLVAGCGSARKLDVDARAQLSGMELSIAEDCVAQDATGSGEVDAATHTDRLITFYRRHRGEVDPAFEKTPARKMREVLADAASEMQDCGLGDQATKIDRMLRAE